MGILLGMVSGFLGVMLFVLGFKLGRATERSERFEIEAKAEKQRGRRPLLRVVR